MERLKERVAIVTGSAQGLGFAIAKTLADEGAWVVISDINESGVRHAIDNLKSISKNIIGFTTDVRKQKEVAEMVSGVVDKWGRIDILVNNAGGALHTPNRLEEIKEEDWDLVLDVNLKGTFFCCQQVIPRMVERKKGSIINISALAAHWRASLAGVQYTAAKAGVEGLTRQLAYDWGPYGIRVNAVAPTVTISGERVKSLWEQKSEEERRRILNQIPLRRLSKPEEIASVVVFLASDESSYVTGITVDVCGGRYLR